jgi:hypothetical protein
MVREIRSKGEIGIGWTRAATARAEATGSCATAIVTGHVRPCRSLANSDRAYTVAVPAHGTGGRRRPIIRARCSSGQMRWISLVHFAM